jgi:hypothetical protein
MRVTKKNHLEDHPIPDGFRIYEERLAVKDIENHRAAAENFCRSLERGLTFLSNPTGFDDHAIGVMGTSRGWTGLKEDLLGFVPKDCARRLAAARLVTLTVPRLATTSVDENGAVEIEFQIIGPEDSYDQYRNGSAKQADIGDEAILDILADAITQTEEEAGAHNLPVAPWPYIVMAKMFRKMGLFDEERAILERYDAQRKPIGTLARQLEDRLREVRRRAR